VCERSAQPVWVHPSLQIGRLVLDVRIVVPGYTLEPFAMALNIPAGVMARLVPVIHALLAIGRHNDVDARDKRA
jgi:hypothetical protein